MPASEAIANDSLTEGYANGALRRLIGPVAQILGAKESVMQEGGPSPTWGGATLGLIIGVIVALVSGITIVEGIIGGLVVGALVGFSTNILAWIGGSRRSR